MFFKIFWLLFVGFMYFPMVLHIPVGVPLDPAFMVEDTADRVFLSVIFWGIFLFVGDDPPSVDDGF
jgi:hypothetical protein